MTIVSITMNERTPSFPIMGPRGRRYDEKQEVLKLSPEEPHKTDELWQIFCYRMFKNTVFFKDFLGKALLEH